MQRLLILLFALIISSPIFAQPFRAAIELELDKKNIIVGEAIYVKATIRNTCDSPFIVEMGGHERNPLNRKESFDVKIFSPDGIQLKKPEYTFSFGGRMYFPTLAPGEEISTYLFLPNWGEITTIGNHRVEVMKQLSVWSVDKDPLTQASTPTGQLAIRSMINLNVMLSTDMLVEVNIERLGKQLFTEDLDHEDRSRKSKRLRHWKDKRIIPYYKKVLDDNVRFLRTEAILGISQFTDDTSVLEYLIDKTIVDYTFFTEETTTEDLAKHSRNSYRHFLIARISQFESERVIPFLVSQKNDPYKSIRLVVIQTLSRKAPETAIPILKEMLEDEDEMVATEAQRLLNELE